MEQENLDILLNELERRGFSDELLAEEITRFSAYHLPIFSLKREKKIDGEQMEYRLMFQWNEPDMSYELKAIEALHCLGVLFDPDQYPAIDIINLDNKMAMIDWEQYWNLNGKDQKLSAFYQDADSIIKTLSELLHSGATEAQGVAGELMYKYFPPDIFAIFSPQPERIIQVYKHGFNFSLEQYPNISANLAYLLISKRAASLESQVEKIIGKQVSLSDIKEEMQLKLKNIPQEVLLDFNWFTKDNTIVELNIPFTKKDSWYYAGDYQLTTWQLPTIPAGVYNNVDAGLLDQRMGKVDWKNYEDLVCVNDFNGIELDRNTEMLQEELFRMALNPQGKEVSDLLMLKYFYKTFFEDQISPGAYELLESLQRKTAYLSPDIRVDKALNMIMGRPVKRTEVEGPNDLDSWQRLRFSGAEQAGELVTMKGLSIAELEKMFAVIPMKYDDFPGSADRLMKGERIETESKSGVPITIMMTKDANRVMICDSNGKEIPFNFHLDPNWRPELDKVEKKKDQKQQRPARNGNSITKR